MALDLDEMSKRLDQALASLTEEDIEKYFPKDTTPKGWVSIEDYLPHCMAMDYIEKGYSTYKVKDSNGTEFETAVTDHNIWYYLAKEQNITHWWNS